MNTFKEREKGFEQKFKHDQELRFKVTARRNKLLGQWAAAKLGVSGPDADAYAKLIVQADFEKPGDDDVFGKVKSDLAAKGVQVSDHELRREMDRLMGVAKEQVSSE